MSRFERALAHTLRHEGGYANHEADPGGATMKGVTQRTYDAHRDRLGLERRSVRHITEGELKGIYRAGYWDPIKGDDLPEGVAFAVFDAGVMSGPARAAKWLQGAAGVPADGIIGPQTLAALVDRDPDGLVHGVCDRRLAFCKRLRHWATFGRGWASRIAAVRAQGVEWAQGYDVTEHAPAESPLPRARGEVKKSATIAEHAKTIGAVAGAAAPAGGLIGQLMNSSGPLAWGLAAAAVIIAVVVAINMLNRRDSEEAA
jgi:lysozyme family protein